MEMTELIEEKEDQLIIDHLVSCTEAQTVKMICDYGCGDGRVLRKLRKKLSPDIQFTGIDIWSDQDCKRARPADENGMTFVENGGAEMDELMSNQQFDLVFSSFALHHFRLPIRELKRMERLLAPGGTFLLIDMYRDFTDPDTIPDNVNFFAGQMTLQALKGDYHRVPYTKMETADLLLALDVDLREQSIVELALTDREVADFKTQIPERRKEYAETAYQQDVSDNRHPAYLDTARSFQMLTADLFEKYGATPDSLLITTAHKRK